MARLADLPSRSRGGVGPACATCGQPVSAADMPGPRWQVDQWFGPNTISTPNGSPLQCAACADAELRARFGRR